MRISLETARQKLTTIADISEYAKMKLLLRGGQFMGLAGMGVGGLAVKDMLPRIVKHGVGSATGEDVLTLFLAATGEVLATTGIFALQTRVKEVNLGRAAAKRNSRLIEPEKKLRGTGYNYE